MKRYVLDIKDFKFRVHKADVKSVLKNFAWLVIISIAATAVGYMVLSCFISTPEEKALDKVNTELSGQYKRLYPEVSVLEDVITGLQQKDAGIYEEVFHSQAPNVDPIAQMDFLFGSDTIPDTKLNSYTTAKADELLVRAEEVERNFARIFYMVSREGFSAPPMTMPLRQVSYPQVGAGEGDKLNPFFRTKVYHKGLDIIVPQGEPVYVPSDGVVVDASRSLKGHGRAVTVDHGNGYVTRYFHLSEIKVKKGQSLRRGQVIGTVGMTGNTFAPHLHYEIEKDSVYLNPINYIFASVTPEAYSNMLFMASNTMQSMD